MRKELQKWAERKLAQRKYGRAGLVAIEVDVHSASGKVHKAIRWRKAAEAKKLVESGNARLATAQPAKPPGTPTGKKVKADALKEHDRIRVPGTHTQTGEDLDGTVLKLEHNGARILWDDGEVSFLHRTDSAVELLK